MRSAKCAGVLRPSRLASRTSHALLVLLLLLAACRPAPPARPNVLLITLDTVRADRLGCYGAAAAATPAIDALAKGGVLFRHAYSPAPLTLPAHATILTGEEPAAHGLVDNGMAAAELGAPTLAERLGSAGYDTAAFVAAFVLNRIFGLDRGFATYDDGPPEETELAGLFHGTAPANERVDAAIAWLQDHLARSPAGGPARPFFLWLHLYDAHAPHAPPPAFAARFAGRPYDGEIAFLDTQVGRLLDFLAARGLERETLVVLAADHGESLGEHGEETHGVFLYDATLRVPLLLNWPGHLGAGREVDEPAALADVAPTVLDLLGLPPDSAVQGRPLLSQKKLPGEEKGASPQSRALWAQSDYPARQYGWAALRSVRRGAWKFIAAPRPELYDLERDPRELRNLAAAEPRRAAELAALARRTGEELAAARAGGDRPAGALAPEVRARLEALGYAAGGNAPDRAEAALDPKDGIARLTAVDRAYGALDRGDPSAAESLFLEALKITPESRPALEGLGKTLELLGRPDEAEAAYRRALAVDPQAVQPLARLAALAARRGDAAAEVEAARRLAEAFPRHAASRRLLADALARAGQAKEAEAAYRQSLALDPKARAARLAWSRFLLTQHRAAEAAPVLQALEAEDPGDPAIAELRARAAKGPR